MGDETEEQEQKQRPNPDAKQRLPKKDKPDESVVSDDEKKRIKPNQPPRKQQR